MPTLRTARDIDARPLLHPLRDAFGLGNRWIRRLSQGLPTLPQGLGFASIGQQAVMANAYKARGQQVEQKALDKDLSRQFQTLELIAFFAMAVGKADPSLSDIDEAMIGNGDAMRIAPDILQDLLRSFEPGHCILPIINRKN
jgi:hypothetical protein